MHADFGIPLEPKELEEWLSQQPLAVQEAARLFPLRSELHIGETRYWIVGFSPDGALVCIRRDPKHVTVAEFKFLVQQADLLDPHAILDYATKH